MSPASFLLALALAAILLAGPAEATPAAGGAEPARNALDAQKPAESRREFEAVCSAFLAGPDPYYGDRQLTRVRARLAAGPRNPDELRRLTQRLGWEQLRLGEPEAALEQFDAVLAGLPQEDFDTRARAATLMLKAIAHLQAAEDLNCLLNHTADSCLLPVAPGAVHRLPAHARAAGDTALEIVELQRRAPDVRAVWILNLARMISGDYPRGVPEHLRLPPDAFTNSAVFPRWHDRGPALGIAAADLAGGAVVDDFDGDGLLDLVSSTANPCDTPKAYRNDGRGGFENVTAAWGLDTQMGGLNLIHADFDNDGRLDLLILRGGWLRAEGRVRNSLLRNTADGDGLRFVDVTHAAGLAEPAYPTQTAAWADYDGDGDLDLYVGNEGPRYDQPHPSQLFRNEGDGRFTDVAKAAGVDNLRYTKGVAWGDANDDGRPDLYVSTIGSPNRLYLNNGDGTFSDRAAALGVTRPTNRSFATWFFDYDNDGRLDLFVADYGSTPDAVMRFFWGPIPSPGAPVVYRNEGERFRDVSVELGLVRPQLPMGANYGDLDNDGWLDFYLGTGEPAYEVQVPNAMYWNRAGRYFEDVSFAGGFAHLQKGHGVAFGDVDNDGDQDLFHQLGGFYPGDGFGNALFENPGGNNRWITLRLRGVKANRFGVGARITVTVVDGDRTRDIHLLAGSGGSFGGSSLQQEIGLGRADVIAALKIVWPGSGTVQVFRDVVPGRIYRVVESADRPAAVAARPIVLSRQPRSHDGH